MSARAKKKLEPEPAELSLAAKAQLAAIWVNTCMAVQLATRDPSGIAGFMTARGRLPKLEDKRKPWSFRGWLLPYVIDVWPICGRAGRWGWWLEAMETGELPGPIPRLDFQEPSRAAENNLERCAQRLSQEVWGSSVPGLLIDWLAWGLAVSDEPARLRPDAEEWLYRELCVDTWLEHPADYLGWIMCEYKGRGKDPTGFFPTPMGVTQLMAEIVAHDTRNVFASVNDPCVGTGRMLLAAANFSVRLSGQDINPVCVKATLVNGALYAPWLAFPLPKMRGEGEAAELPLGLAAPTFDEAGQGLLFPVTLKGDGS